MTDDNYLHLLPQWADVTRWKETQQWVVEEIVSRFNDGNKLVVLNAPTGAGKSLLAEMVRRILSTDAIYLCTTLSLQDQFINSFPEARLIKGRAHYRPTHPTPDMKGDLPTCADCDLSPHGCSYCEEPDMCGYRVAVREAAESALSCTNMAYFMGSCMSPRSPFRGRSLGILDEAHLGPQEVLRHVSVTISPGFRDFLGIEPPERKTVESAWPEWFVRVIPQIERRRNQINGDSLSVKRLKGRLDKLLIKLMTIQADLDGWIYCYDNRGTIEWKPIRTDKIAPGALTNHANSWLAMSATIVPEHFVQEMGWEESWASVAAPSTFPAERRPIYFCPSAYMTKKNEETAWPEMATALRVVLDRHPDERVLVHTQSYGLNKHLFASLEGINRPVFTYQSSDQRQQSIADYEATEGAVLLASSLEQGYDGKDDLCRVVVLTKLMYPSLGDKQIAARLRSPGGNFWYAAMTAESIQQAVGRGMRHENDSVVVYVLDSMFTKFYGEWKKLFAPWFTEALHWDSPVRYQVARQVRERTESLQLSSAGSSIVSPGQAG